MNHNQIDDALAKAAELLRDHPLGEFHSRLLANRARAEAETADAERIPLMAAEIVREATETGQVLDEQYLSTPAGIRLYKFAQHLRKIKSAPRPTEAVQTAIKAALVQQISAKWNDAREPEMLFGWLNGRKIARLTARACEAADGDKIDRLALREAHRPVTFRGAFGEAQWANSFPAIPVED